MTVIDDQPHVDTSPDSTDATVRPSASRSLGRTILGSVLPPFTLGLGILAVWYTVSYVVLDERRRFLLKPPHQVV